MVAESRIPEEQAVGVEDLVPVRSRVSWPAIFAGSVMALATFFVLMLLGAAVGLTVYDNVTGSNLNTEPQAVWAVMATILALFVGGWVVSQATVGENKCEAAIHGVIMWGVTFAFILTMAGMGVRAGFGAMVGVATIADRTGVQANANQPGAQPAVNQQELERSLREANFTDEQIAKVRDTIKNPAANVREAVNNPENRERVATASWWTLFGVLLSMTAAIGGALVGAGPTFRLLAAGGYARTTVRQREVART